MIGRTLMLSISVAVAGFVAGAATSVSALLPEL